jgi:glycosyl transferase family 25
MDVDQPITAAAYMIGRQAAEGLLKANTPIAVAADSWRHFYSKNAFESLRVLFPSPISTKNFKSSIDYLNPKSIKGILSEIINKYKVPLAYQYLNFRRNSELNKRLHFSLSEEKSPLDRSSH